MIPIFLVPAQQARNQFWTPGVAKSFLRGAQFFKTMSNSFQLCSTLGRTKNFVVGVKPLLRPPGYGPAEQQLSDSFCTKPGRVCDFVFVIV